MTFLKKPLSLLLNSIRSIQYFFFYNHKINTEISELILCHNCVTLYLDQLSELLQK